MSDNNNYDDIEFLNIDETDSSDITSAPVSEYQSADEADDVFTEAARRYQSASDEPLDTPTPRHKNSSMTRAERRRRRRRKLLIRRIVFCSALIIFIFSGTMLVKSLLDYNKADKIYKNVENVVFATDTPDTKKPSPGDNLAEAPTESVLLKNYDHAALLALNPDAVGYLQIPAIDVLLPVVQGTDNEYYLSHTLTGESSKNGTLFIDCRNTDGIESQNTIIYGHNMKNGSMFGSLRKFMDKDFFAEGDNKYFYFYIGNKIYKYEIYSVHTTPAVSETYATEFESGDAFLSYTNAMIRASYHSTSVSMTGSSKTITLSTCTNDDDVRLVIQALRIEELLQ
ncbi:MAG: class B sortase [Thermoflexaceae bacterium]|nr:class B sortase [Thermoflexaceae bacterium]